VDLELSEEEAELRDNVRSVISGVCPPSVVRAVYENKGEPGAVWNKMVELYWPAMGVAEDLGGLGMSFVQLALVAEELGRATVPSPFLATVTQFAPAVRELGRDEHHRQFLSKVAAGELTGTLALAEHASWRLDRVEAIATKSADGWTLTGTKHAVLDGATADEVVVIARAAGSSGTDGLGAFVVPGASLDATPRPVMDPTMPMADVALDGVTVPADRVLAEPGAAGVAVALQRAVEESVVAMAIMTAGTCRKIFDDTLEYAKQREQYDRLIGSFQAIKHRFADMYLAVERASALCYFAALTIAEEDSRRAEAAALAKAAAGECQRLLVREGLQLHGGIGYTWEHDLHFLLKRAKTGDLMFGTAASHRAHLTELLGLTGGRAA
jgi:alkylation response protein AidB-like acyl-CoA dehydrogenase